MDVDGETVVAWLRTWGVEAVLCLLGLAGVALGARGDLLTLVLGATLLAAAADRVRLRLDNRSLAEAVAEASEVRVSAARRETPGDVEQGGGDASETPPGERAAAPDADG